MDCIEAIDVMGDAVESRLDRWLRMPFDRHLTECGPCRTYFAQLRITRAALQNLPPERGVHPRRGALIDAFRTEYERN